MSADATRYMSSSVPLPFSALMAHKTIRQLSWVYPFLGKIWSMLGENDLGPLPFSSIRKGIPVNSQHPVHRARIQSGVRSKAMLNFFARPFALATSLNHGE